MKKLFIILPALLAMSPMAWATDDVGSAVTGALATGATSATTFLIAAIAIPIAFLVFKIGKRALSRA